MTDWKYGDVVTNIATGHTVTVHHANYPHLFVDMGGSVFFKSDYEKATAAIVAKIVNGTPRPSSFPFVHTSVVNAEREARRLGDQHPGSKFGTFRLVSVSGTDIPPSVTRAA